MTHYFIHHIISLYLAAGALLVASGLFLVLRRNRVSDFIAGLFLLASGINIHGLVFSRSMTGTRAGDIFSFFIIIAAMAIAVLMFAFRISGASGERTTRKDASEKRSDP